jgi:hypothetical protein
MTQRIAQAIQYWVAVISGVALVLSLGLAYFGWGGHKVNDSPQLLASR